MRLPVPRAEWPISSVETGADIGLALDGDGDRVIVVDENGRILDGDQIMALCAQDLMERDALPGRTLVATVMSNMALEVFMSERAAAGPHSGGRPLRGGGHAPHGRGLRRRAVRPPYLSGLRHHGRRHPGRAPAFADHEAEEQAHCPSWPTSSSLFPRSWSTSTWSARFPFEESAPVGKAVAEAVEGLGGRGRVLLRYSGTEPWPGSWSRVRTATRWKQLATELAQTVKKHLR